MKPTSSTRTTRFARIWADLLNPLFLSPPLFIILALLYGAGMFDTLTSFGIALLMFCLFPFWYLFHLKKKSHIQNLDIVDPKNRNKPYVFGKLCYISAFMLFLISDTHLNGIFLAICLIYLVNSAIYMCINFFTKISIHSAGIATFGTLILLNLPDSSSTLFILLAILFTGMTGIMMWSRVYMKFHTFNQTILGSGLAVLLCSVQFDFYLTLFTVL